MANETKRSSAAAALYATQVEERILRAARGANVALNLVTRKMLDDPGPIAHTFNRFTQIDETTAVGALTEATDPGNTEITTATGVTVTAAMYGLNAELSDVLKSTSVADFTPGSQDEMGRAVAAKVDRTILALASGFSSQVGTTTVDATLTLINSARFTLDTNEAPDGNAGDDSSYGPTPAGLRGKILVLPPIGMFDYREALSTSQGAWITDPKAAEVLYEDGTKPAGFKGSLFGIPVFESVHLPSANSEADTLGLMLVPGAIGVAIKWLLRLREFEDVKKRTTAYAADAFFGAAELNDDWGVGFIIGAT